MSRFQFKKFTINQSRSTLKVGTDAMLLGAFIKENTYKSGLDIGSGTGVLSLMVAQNQPNILIDAIEIDNSSFEDLRQNVLESVFKHQIRFFKIDFFVFESKKKYDLIFSNPPFYDDGVQFENEIKFHAKHNVNFSKKKFFSKCADLLSETGEIWIIVPFDKAELWIQSALEFQLFLMQCIDIESKQNSKVRCVLVFSFIIKDKIDFSNFIIRDENGFYTSDYHFLTREFHNKQPLK